MLSGAGAFLAAAAWSPARAQSVDVPPTATAVDSGIFSPIPDGSRRETFSFNRARPGFGDGRSRFGEIPTYGRPPGSGAGSTGFDSTNALRRKARLAKPRPGPRSPGPPPEAPVPTVANPAATAPLLPPRMIRHGAPANGTLSGFNIPSTIETPRRSAPALVVDAFEPVGLRLGAFTLKPAIEFTGGFDSNPARSQVNRGSTVGIVAPELLVRSDWQRHALNADLRGSYTAYGNTFAPQAPEILDRPAGDSKIYGRVDVTSLSHIDAEARLLVWTDNPGSPNVQVGLRRMPIVTTVGGTLGFTQQFNRFEIAAKGTIDRIAYQPSTLVDGTVTTNDDRNYDQYGGALRGSYELMPGLKPFVEIGADTRVRDLPIDRTGMERDSNGQYVKAGTTFEFHKRLTGEISTGYLQREYKDPSLPDLGGITVDGTLIYAATPLTTFTLTARSSADEIVIPNVSGVFRRDIGLQVDHAFRRWLIGTLKVGFGYDDYVGMERIDHRHAVSASVLYKMSRDIWLKGEVRRDWLRSDVAGVDWTANTVLLGVRLQR